MCFGSVDTSLGPRMTRSRRGDGAVTVFSSGPSASAVNRLSHLGHFTFWPTASGLAGLSTVKHSGQVSLETIDMVVRPVRPAEPAHASIRCPTAPILSHQVGFRQTLTSEDPQRVHEAA